jgi:hypothetical protein
MARPGATGFVSSASEAMAVPGTSREGRLAVREVLLNRREPIGHRLSDAAEILTWRALNVGPDRLAKLTDLPERLWTHRRRIRARLMTNGMEWGMEWMSRRGTGRNGTARNEAAAGRRNGAKGER